MVWPVIYDARSEASQTMVSASSRGSPRRLRGESAAKAARTSLSVLPEAVARALASCFRRSVAGNSGAKLLCREPSFPDLFGGAFPNPSYSAAPALVLNQATTGCLWGVHGFGNVPCPL